MSLCLGTSLFSCSHWDRWFGESTKNQREFVVRSSWVRQGPEKDNLGFRKINRMTPILIGDLILSGNSLDGLVAYERETGQVKWRLNVLNGIEGNTTLINRTLFLGGLDGQFYSIDALSGKINWKFPIRSEFLSEPLLIEENLYVLSGNNTLYSLDAVSGKQNWVYTRQDTSSLSIRGGSKPAYRNETLYLGFSDGALVSLNEKTGNVKWELQLNKGKRFRDIDASPIIDGDYIYVAGYDDRLYCIHADRGEIQWKVDGGGYSQVTILGDKIYFPTSGGEIIALKKSSGEKIWSYKLNRGIATQIKTYKGFLVFGESQGGLVFMNPQNGAIKYEFEPGRGILSTPQIDEKNNHLYFISGEANVYSIEAKWEWPTWFRL